MVKTLKKKSKKRHKKGVFLIFSYWFFSFSPPFATIHSNILKNMRIRKIKIIKTSRQLEKHLKGVSNHWRIEILFLVADEEGLTLDQICEHLNGNIKTISEHTRKLSIAGLINKRYLGKNVSHSLSPYGKIFVNFLKTF